MRRKLVLAIYLIMATVHLALGAVYFFSNQFLSYHAQAVGAPWQEVDPDTQTLILALMKVAGGGWSTLGFFTIVLAVMAFRTSSAVARWTMPAGTIILYFASFTATWGVAQATGAATPWGPSLAMIVFALLALLIDAPWSSRVRLRK